MKDFEWLPVSEELYKKILFFLKLNNTSLPPKVLEFGSSTGHISFRLAREGINVSMLDIRNAAIDFARTYAQLHKIDNIFFYCDDFLLHNKKYDFIWNSGLLQCLVGDRRVKFVEHCAKISRRALVFYPDKDSGKRNSNRKSIPGVGDAIEYSVLDIPIIFSKFFDKIYFGKLDRNLIKLNFDMLYIYSELEN